MSINHLAFCEKPIDEYANQFLRESHLDKPLEEVSYRYQTEQKTLTVAEKIFSCLYHIATIPYQLLRWLASKIIVPATSYYRSECTEYRSTLTSRSILDLNTGRPIPLDENTKRRILLSHGFFYKRISVEVDGMKIDAMLAVNKSNPKNGKWILHSNGNGAIYELLMCNTPNVWYLKRDRKIEANVLMFNYPCVGASEGTALPETIAKTYKAMLRFLNKKEQGIGAETIIGYGYSLGGAAQAIGLEDHELDPDINYVFIKDRTFSTLSKAAADIAGTWAGKLVELVDWNLDTEACSIKLQADEIILQAAKKQDDGTVELKDDGIISKGACLAEPLSKKETQGHKTFIPLTNYNHGHPLGWRAEKEVVKAIEESITKQIDHRINRFMLESQAI